MRQRQEKAQIDGNWQDIQTEEFMNKKMMTQEQVLSSGSKRLYRKPSLAVLGDLRTMTLSPTPSTTQESGNGTYTYDGVTDFTTDQFEGGTSRRTDSSSDSGRSGRD